MFPGYLGYLRPAVRAKRRCGDACFGGLRRWNADGGDVRRGDGRFHGAWHGIPDPHVLLLASVEAIAAALFLAPWTVRFGGGLLLTVFAVAFGLHAFGGEIAWPLAVYSAAVAFVIVHGPAHRSSEARFTTRAG